MAVKKRALSFGSEPEKFSAEMEIKMSDDGKADQKLVEPSVQAAIMQIIQAESAKAKAFVPHMLSLGQLRERIFRRILIESMPRKVSIDTGLITNTEWNLELQTFDTKYSKQIDLLLHDHFNHVPVYQLDDFVVASLSGALAAVEIKSNLDKVGFDAMVAVNESVRDLARYPIVEGFGYALNGVDFATIRKYVSDLLRSPTRWKHQLATLPIGICCQDQNYVFIRPSRSNYDLEKPYLFAARPRKGVEGWAMTVFVQCLRMYAANETHSMAEDRLPRLIVYNWYNELNLAQFEKYHIDCRGEWYEGNEPVKPYGH